MSAWGSSQGACGPAWGWAADWSAEGGPVPGSGFWGREAVCVPAGCGRGRRLRAGSRSPYSFGDVSLLIGLCRANPLSRVGSPRASLPEQPREGVDLEGLAASNWNLSEQPGQADRWEEREPSREVVSGQWGLLCLGTGDTIGTSPRT